MPHRIASGSHCIAPPHCIATAIRWPIGAAAGMGRGPLKVRDECGVCGGDGSSCDPRATPANPVAAPQLTPGFVPAIGPQCGDGCCDNGNDAFGTRCPMMGGEDVTNCPQDCATAAQFTPGFVPPQGFYRVFMHTCLCSCLRRSTHRSIQMPADIDLHVYTHVYTHILMSIPPCMNMCIHI